MHDLKKVAIFGGVYNNYLALEAVLDDAQKRGCEKIYCLGDLGGFGPHPDRVFPILQSRGVIVMQGNYDHSIGHALPDCGCGYTDPRDNHFAQLSYDYTQKKTSEIWRPYLRNLPTEIRESWGTRRVLMAHGSPRKVNEFLWESNSSDAFLRRLCDEQKCDVLFVTHSGIPWVRDLGDRLIVNVGAIGRPANDGRREVWYSTAHINWRGERSEPSRSEQAMPARMPINKEGKISAELIPVAYDWQRLAKEMREEGICEEFVETIETGWWTTCLEILPAKERARGKY